MGNIIPFSNHPEKKIKKDDVIKLKSMIDSPITAKIRILPQEIHILLRVLLQERKDVQSFHKEAMGRKDKKEIEYWISIKEAINSLIGKLKSANQLEEVLQVLSFVELDCLVGAVEQYLQEIYLLKMQIVEDDTPLITKALEAIYEKILPLYEEKRKDFDE